MAKSKFQNIFYHNNIITHSSNLKTTMSFLIKFVVNFFSFKIDSEPNKYLFNSFNLPLPI